jgi:hypothetical protein
MTSAFVLVQVVAVLPVDGVPARFGLPVPAVVARDGLMLDGPPGGALCWRRLPVGTADPTGPDALVWVEIALASPPGRVRVRAGRGGTEAPLPCRRATATHADCALERTEWLWPDGQLDCRHREVFSVATARDGEPYLAGEALTGETPELAQRARLALQLPRAVWERAGLLPPAGRLGEPFRRHLLAVAGALTELPGRRGQGDFARSGGVVTNLEFDTTLALLRLALALEDPDLLVRARRSAWHLVDRDFDAATGLPFPHGSEHRTGRPEPGHAWLQGLLGVALVTADDALLASARALARGIAGSLPQGQGRAERARDYAWPLLELERWLAVETDPVVATAANRLAAAIALRFDPMARTFRFGEGEVGGGVYLERGWITAGIVLPALRAHLQRRPDARLQERLQVVTRAILDQIGIGRPGLPTHWRTAGGRTFAEHRARGDAALFLMLDGLPLAEQRRLLRRDELHAALLGVPALDDPDLPTAFTLAARSSWIYR